MREFLLEKAPGKELIPILVQEPSYEKLGAFYNIRVNWHGYPIVHDYLVSYGLFDDLMQSFPNDSEQIAQFIDYSIDMASQETDNRFVNSLFLLLGFCQRGKSVISPTQFQYIIELRPRVQKLSFIANMVCFWNQLLDCLPNYGDYNKNQVTVSSNDYLQFIDLNFPSLDNNTAIACPVTTESIQKEMRGMVGKYEPLQFKRSAIIEDNQYWVWLYKNITGNIWNWYITVTKDPQGNVKVEKYSMYRLVTMTPEQLLLKYHFGS
jgi:hypothetical protein